MISGIAPVLNQAEMKFPLRQSLRSWSRVCDEIVVICGDEDVPFVEEIRGEVEQACRLLVQGVSHPREHNIYRDLGYFFCDSPDWVVHFDADYLISPENAVLLRRELEEAKSDVDAMVYRLVYLNYEATATFWYWNLHEEIFPFNGYEGFYPLVVNRNRDVLVFPFEGFMEDNTYNSPEGICSLGHDRWGRGYFPQSGRNHSRFNLKMTEVTVEHLTWSLAWEHFLTKCARNKMKIQDAVNGLHPYPISYPELDSARSIYACFRKEAE